MMLNNFISRSMDQYQSISFFDSLRSTLPLYFFIGFLILYIGVIILFLSGVKGTKWVLLFCGFIVFLGWTWVKLYQHYELKAPVKKKIFNYRLAQALSLIDLSDELSESGENAFSGIIQLDHTTYGISIRYSQDLWRNVGGIIPGTPIQIPDKIHPRTWFLEIIWENENFDGPPCEYHFSARKDDDDTEDGYGVFLYDSKTYELIKQKTEKQKRTAQLIQKTIDGTILKGSMLLTNKQTTLRIFDNIKKIRRWRKPAIRYKDYQNLSKLLSDGIPAEQAAFYNINNLLKILL